MNLILLQTAPGDAMALLENLQGKLSKKILVRTDVIASNPLEADELPRCLARLPDAMDADETQIKAALDGQCNGAFELTRGELIKDFGLQEDSMMPNDQSVPGLDWLPPPPTRPSGPLGDIMDEIGKILAAEPSGMDFPEKTYDPARKTAYDSICQQLGREPMVDQGKVLTLGSFVDVKKPKRPRIDPTIWNEVIGHLKDEVEFFGFARKWFGDGGHIRNCLRDQVFLDKDFADRLNTAYGLVPSPKTQITLFANLAMAIATRIISVSNPFAGFALSTIWSIAMQVGGGGSEGEIRAAIDEIKLGVTKRFSDTIEVVENCLGAILTDWGNLGSFGKMIKGDKIEWPVDGKPIRIAHAIGFHYECLRSLTAIKAKAETHSDLYSKSTWGVIRGRTSSDKPVKRHFDWNNGILKEASGKKDCNRYPYVHRFMGGMTAAWQDDYGWHTHGKVASISLSKKMFGGDQTDPIDPQLKISDSFLETVKNRNGWELGYADIDNAPIS